MDYIKVPTDTNPAKSGDVQKLGSLSKGNPNASGKTNHKPAVGG